MPPRTPEMRVVVTDFDMPFWSMAGFMVKVALAAIPAALILAIGVGMISVVLTMLFGAGAGSVFGR